MTPLWKVEFHCHTMFSKDSLTRPEDLVATCRRKGIDRVIVTDHNETAGAFAAQALDPELVIVGEEVMTTKGELLAAYVTETIPKGLEPLDAIARLRAQGAFISVSHPFDRARNGAWELAELERIVPLVDAIEVFNARCLEARINDQALAFANQHGLPGTAGSDAHTLRELGVATLRLAPFHDAESLKLSVRTAAVEGRLSSPWVHFASTWARIRKQGK